MISIIFLYLTARPHLITVGPGKEFREISTAIASAKSGDTIEVFRSPDNYRGTHVLVTKSHIQIVGMGDRIVIQGEPDQHVTIDGTGFDYSGAGQIPRAIFQFDPRSYGDRLVNLDLTNAHNRTFNGAGVRINGGNSITIENCEIHNCDMGIMSNGIGDNPLSGSDQKIEGCYIYDNGNQGQAGYNHNLYLGGENVLVESCEIDDPLTGDNLKSRAHFNLIEYNNIHGAVNREVDLVDSDYTKDKYSNSVLIGNLITKNNKSTGNHNVIHFGAESGDHNGTLFLLHNTISTPFSGPVIELDLTDSSVVVEGNCFVGPSHGEGNFCQFFKGATSKQVRGQNNIFTRSYLASINHKSFKKMSLLDSTGQPVLYPRKVKSLVSFDNKLPQTFTYVNGSGKRKIVWIELSFGRG